uniref:Uncharacterized protein n=1 Tax=Rhizophora mucronata TaxID=61149 RepID=A0A2P2MT04_RHIMU
MSLNSFDDNLEDSCRLSSCKSPNAVAVVINSFGFSFPCTSDSVFVSCFVSSSALFVAARISWSAFSTGLEASSGLESMSTLSSITSSTSIVPFIRESKSSGSLTIVSVANAVIETEMESLTLDSSFTATSSLLLVSEEEMPTPPSLLS